MLMEHPDLERSFGYVLYDTARLLARRWDQRARRLGLTRAQCQVLSYLVRSEGINQSGLAELLDIEPISLARLIDRMEQAGWVERRADPLDRRARLLYVTPKARPVFEQIMEVSTETRADALAGISEPDGDQLMELLLRVRNNLSQKSVAAGHPRSEGSVVLNDVDGAKLAPAEVR